VICAFVHERGFAQSARETRRLAIRESGTDIPVLTFHNSRSGWSIEATGFNADWANLFPGSCFPVNVA